jgi:hypothetical protein
MSLILTSGFSPVRLLWENVQAAMNVEIHNGCSDVELIEPWYFSDGAVCCKKLNERVAPGDILSTAFRIHIFRTAFEGALICGLRKKGTNSDQQSSVDTTNVDEDRSKHVQLIVGWKVTRFHDPRVYVLLMEHEERSAWDVDKLKKQHEDFHRRLHAHNCAVENIWLMEDGTVLKLTLDSVGNKEYGIKISISEVQWDDYATLPVPIEQKV